jgi:hypothetical protein
LATTAKRVKDAKIQKKFEVARDAKKPRPKFSTRRHNRCSLCGRPRAFLRKFGVVLVSVQPVVRGWLSANASDG